MYYIMFVLTVSITLPDGRSGYKEILETPKLEHCIYEANKYADLLSRPEYKRQIEKFNIKCEEIRRHDV